MPAMIGFHEVDDVAHWLASPKRAEVFAEVATDLRTFIDPQNPNRVALFMEVADPAALEAVLQSEAGAAAMEFDGVRPETVEMFVEA